VLSAASLSATCWVPGHARYRTNRVFRSAYIPPDRPPRCDAAAAADTSDQPGEVRARHQVKEALKMRYLRFGRVL